MATVLSLSHFIPFDTFSTIPDDCRSIAATSNRENRSSIHACRYRGLPVDSRTSSNSIGDLNTRHDLDTVDLSPAHLTRRNTSPSRCSVLSSLSISRSHTYSALSDSAMLRNSIGNDCKSFSSPGTIARDAEADKDDDDDHDHDHDHDHDVDNDDLSVAQETWHDPEESRKFRDAGEDLQRSQADIVEFQEQPQLQTETQAFARWINTLRKRHNGSQQALLQVHNKPEHMESLMHRSESYSSSLAFVTGIRSTSMTMTNLSVPSIQIAPSTRSPHSKLYLTSNPASHTDLRRSIDSERSSATPALDEAALKRSHKRARKIHELVQSEEGYVSDLKCLQNAYFTLLPLQATNAFAISTTTQACLLELIQLHEQISSELSELSTKMQADSQIYAALSKPQPRSLTATAISRQPYDPKTNVEKQSATICNPHIVAGLAKIFSTKSKLLNVYEEYGARCIAMQMEADMQFTAPMTDDYARGLETLQGIVSSAQDSVKGSKKALGLKDLIIKPIQRITRYELLLKELCSLTPSCDDPVAHAELDNALFIVARVCHELNEVQGDDGRLKLFESYRLLRQRLQFSQGSSNLGYTHFGRLVLCGSLYITYRTSNSIRGQYVVSMLFESTFILASAKSSTSYQVLVAIDLANAVADDSDTGRGLQCHTTPHAWKLVFEHGSTVYELLCIACSATEAEVWRQGIAGRIALETQYAYQNQHDRVVHESPLLKDLQGTGKAYGKRPEFIQQRSPIQRAATLGPMTETNQVIIKNTQAVGKDVDTTSLSFNVTRSQSLATPSHIAVLTPRRNDRIQLEILLSDVWTKDAIPYPGLGTRRNEYSMRASAGHVIRKLSMASITSNFSIRSLSHNSGSHSSSNDSRSFRAHSRSRASSNAPTARKIKPVKTNNGQATVVNFHTAPEAFLPEDFKLDHPAKARGRLAGLRTLTMGAERSRSSFSPNSDMPTSLRRSRSVLTQVVVQRDVSDHRTVVGLDTGLPAAIPKGDGDLYMLHNAKLGKRQRAKSRLAKLLT